MTLLDMQFNHSAYKSLKVNLSTASMQPRSNMMAF